MRRDGECGRGSVRYATQLGARPNRTDAARDRATGVTTTESRAEKFLRPMLDARAEERRGVRSERRELSNRDCNNQILSLESDDDVDAALMTHVDVRYVYENLVTQRAQVVDCRGSALRRVPGATVVSFGKSSTESVALDKCGVDVGRPVVLVDEGSELREEAKRAFSERMEAKVMVMEGGMRAWVEAGYPTSGETSPQAKSLSKQRLLIWAPPRSRSTALERSLSKHSQAMTMHELLTEPFLMERSPHNYQKIIDGQDAQGVQASCGVSYKTALEVLATDFSAQSKPFLVAKELSCYFDQEKITDEWLLRFRHVVLVRDPLKTLKSFYRVSVEGDEPSSYFDVSEAGFRECFMILDRLHAIGAEYEALDADSDLMKHPEETLRRICNLVDVKFEKSMLAWEARELASWEKFRGWHDDVSNSTGFQEIKKPPLEYPKEVFTGAAWCRPFYDAILWSSMRTMETWPTVRSLDPSAHKYNVIISASDDHLARDMHAKFLAARLPGASVHIFQPKWVLEAKTNCLDVFASPFVLCGPKSKVEEMHAAIQIATTDDARHVARGLILGRDVPREDVERLPFPCVVVEPTLSVIDQPEFIEKLEETILSDLLRAV